MNPLGALWAKYKPALKLPELVAIALLGITTMFYESVLDPAEERLRALEDKLANRKPPGPILPAGYPAAPANPAAKLAVFYSFFDKGLTFTDWLARLYDVAEKAGVELRQGDYRRVEPADVPLVLQEVTLPVTGDYARIRIFAEGALNAIPIASLDQISFRRQRANQSQVEAELKFTLHLSPPVR